MPIRSGTGLGLKLLARLVEKGEISDRIGDMGRGAVDVATGQASGRRISPQEQDLTADILEIGVDQVRVSTLPDQI